MAMPNIVLAGFMGTGKTTIGQIVADRLGMPFIDLDDAIEAEAGQSIAEIFASRGFEEEGVLRAYGYWKAGAKRLFAAWRRRSPGRSRHSPGWWSPPAAVRCSIPTRGPLSPERACLCA